MPEGQLPSAPRRRFDTKDRIIAALGGAVLLLLFLVVKDHAGAGGFLAALGGEKVTVFDVILDRDNRSYVDILFDRPLGEGLAGEVLADPPATISPAVGGVWKWRDAAALRFEPSSSFDMATEYTIKLDPGRLVKKGQRFRGARELKIRTDQFLVEGVTVYEEPAPEAGKGAVVLRGEIRFNYAVEPEELAPKLKLTDGGSEVQVLLESTWATPGIEFRTAAVRKQPAERQLRLGIAAALTPAEGNVPLAEAYVHEIPVGSSEKLALRSAQATSGERESVIRLTFSSPVAADVAGRFVTVEPKIEFRLAADRNDLVLTGPFLPGRSYKVAAGQGLPASDGAVLQEPWANELSFSNLAPVARFQSEGFFLAASGAKTLSVESINTAVLHLAVDRVYRNNLFDLFQYRSYDLDGSAYRGNAVASSLGDRIHQEDIKVKGEPNRRTVTPLKLDRIVSGHEPGFYRVEVSRDEDYAAEQRWVLVTDLGLVAKHGGDELLVWVSSFASLEPLAGVRVRLLSNQNQILGEATTGGDGAARFKSESLGKGMPFLILAERGEDFSFLYPDHSRVDLTGFDLGGASAERQGYDAFLYGERDLYRPGEVVEGVAVVRDKSLEAPPPMPVLLVHRDPQGQETESQRLTTDSQGLVPFRLETEAVSETGDHELELKVGERVLGSYRFQVEEFIPDRIKVGIEPGAPRLVGAGPLPFTVTSSYLFGPPAAGLAVESRVRLEAADFAPKGFEAYAFGNPEKQFQEVEVLASAGELDAAGKRSFTAVVPPGLTPPAALTAVIVARAQEKGGRGVTAMSRVPVHTYARYVGLRRLAAGSADPGKPVELEWVSVAPDGAATPAGELRAELYHDRWNTVLRRTGDGTFRYESVRDPLLVESKSLAAGQARGTFTLTPRTWGAFRVVISDLGTGSATEQEFYAAGWGYSPWAIKSPGKVEIELDRDSYVPGTTATVQIRAPFAGRLLLTVERDGVLKSETHRLTGNTATIQLPVEASWRPNVYVTATLLRSAGELAPGEPGRAFGAVPLAVDRAEKKLPIDIQAGAEMRPGKTLEVAVRTAPGAAVTVAAVDEGILRLIGQETPDPFAYFYRKLALGVTSYDTFALLFPDRAAPPAGGDAAFGLRSQFVSTASMLRVEPAAYWSGLLKAGSDGRAVARFEVADDFQGSLRLMAVAIDGDRFGSGEGGTRVRDKIVALPTLPRFLQLGDELEVPVTVHNDTGAEGTFKVALSWQLPGEAKQVVEQGVRVADKADGVVYLPAGAASQVGVAEALITVEGNGEATRARAKLPVRAALPAQSRLQAGTLKGRETKLAADLGGFEPESVSQRLTLGPGPVVALTGKLVHLLQYPYGCLEQTTSRTFPLVYLADLARALEPTLFEERDPDALVAEGLRRIASMQLPSGAFAMWPGGDKAEPWASLYATHLLVEAEKAGHEVDSNVSYQALSYVGSLVTAKATYGRDELERVAYALFILARADRADRGSMDFLREKHGKTLPAEARALLAAAYAAVGSPELIDGLIAGIDDVDRVERQTGVNFSSTLRNRALLLLALAEARPEDPRIPELAERIAREAETGDFWTTQESAFAFLALGKLYDREEGEEAPAVTVGQGGKAVGSYSGEPITWTDLGPGALALRAPGELPPGRVYYSLTTRGVPTEAAFKPEAEGLEIERTFSNRDGGGIDLDGLAQGDLVVMKTRVRSTSGPVANVVISNLLPPGLEVENPRLKSSETLTWVTDANLEAAALDLRDDRVLVFTDLPDKEWRTLYSVLRAVTPGTFKLPPPQAEAMYNPRLRATGQGGEVHVAARR